MTYKTHFVGGACAVALASTFVEMPIETMVISTAVSAFSALVPDVDIDGSKINRKLGLLGKGFAAVSHHRGFFHTPILYIVLYFLISVLSKTIATAFLIGTISHLVLDTFNSKGIMWLWPLTRKHYHIARIKTRSTGETVFMIVMIVITLFVFIKENVFAYELFNLDNIGSFTKNYFQNNTMLEKVCTELDSFMSKATMLVRDIVKL